MESLERIKEHTDDEDICKDISELQNRIQELPDRIKEKELIKKRTREQFKKRGGQ